MINDLTPAEPATATRAPRITRCALPAPQRSSAARLLHQAIDMLEREDLEGLPDAALGDDLVTLRAGIDRLEAEVCRRLGRFERQGGHLAAGAASLVSWLRGSCRISGGAAATRVEVARRLPELPQTARALRCGDIGFEHAAVIARSAGELGPQVVRSTEPTLLEAARQLDPGRLRLVTRHLRHTVDPDGALADANRDHERRRLHLSQTLDGVFVLDGLLDAEGGAMVRGALTALGGHSAGDDRSAAQRRADALVELARRQLGGGALPAVGGQRPQLLVTVTAAALRGDVGEPAGDLGGAGPIPAETARRLACDAALATVTLDSTGAPLSVGRTRRTIPPAVRRALVVRDRGCRFPGCDRPPEWTDGHHLRHWAAGGETRLDNLVLLCRRHHRRVHDEGWQLRWGADATVVAIPP